MNKKSSIVNYFFIFLSILLYAYLIIKISKLYFLNPPDEYEFKKLILKTNINNYDFTSPLYIFLYSFIKNFENNFYLYTKYLNLIFFLGGNIFVYFITKNLSNNFLAKIVFLLSSIYPYHLYTSAVMPESLFYFYFYFTFYLFLTIQNTNLKYVITSLNFFNLFLIKGTGLFIFIAFLLSEIVSYYKIKKKNYRNIFILIFFFIFLYIFFYLIISKNNSGFIFGKKYEVLNFSFILENFNLILFNFLKNFTGHVFYIILIYGIPIILLIKYLYNNKFFSSFLLFPLFIILLLPLFSSSYHSFWVVYGNEPLYRIGTRFYDFSFPLFLITVAYFDNLFLENNKLSKKISILLIIILSLFAMTQLNYLRPTFVTFDGILLRGILYNQLALNLFLLISLCGLILNFYKKINLVKYYFFFFIPFLIFVACIPINKEMESYKNPDQYIDLGLKLKNKLNKQNIIVYYDSLKGDDYKVLFYLNVLSLKKYRELNIDSIINNKNVNTVFIVINNNHKIAHLTKTKNFLDNKYLLIE